MISTRPGCGANALSRKLGTRQNIPIHLLNLKVPAETRRVTIKRGTLGAGTLGFDAWTAEYLRVHPSFRPMPADSSFRACLFVVFGILKSGKGAFAPAYSPCLPARYPLAESAQACKKSLSFLVSLGPDLHPQNNLMRPNPPADRKTERQARCQV
jgi:hypothetical protein